MRDSVTGRVALLVVYGAIALLFSIRTYTTVRRRGWTRLLRSPARHVLVVVLLAAGVICSVIKPAPPWAPILTIVLITYGVLGMYAIAVDALEDRQVRLSTTPGFWWVTALLGATLVFDYLRGDNRGNFVDNEPYVPTIPYFVANMLAIAPILGIETAIARVYWRSVRTYHALDSVVASVYTFRRMTGLVAFSVGAIGLAMIELKLVLAMLGVPSPLADRMFTISTTVIPPLSTALVLVSISVTWPYTLVARALRAVSIRRRRHDYARLAYLQQQMLTVVPTVPHVELADPQQQWNRALTEIADAREVLWSDAPRTTPITPNDEARRIWWRLLHPKARTVGPYLHPPIDNATVVQHNLAVARALHQLEQQQSTNPKEDDAHDG